MIAPDEVVIVKKNAPSGTIILNRPERRNALTRYTIHQLQQAFTDLHQERQVRAVILTGNGPAFCAGMDLAEMKKTAEQDDALQMWYRDASDYKELVEQMLRFPKPIIAAVHGPAVAGGMGLILAADLVVASPDARFALPEARRGIAAGLVIPLVAFRAGASLAANLSLRGHQLSTDQAIQAGICHESVEEELLWARAHSMAEEVAKSAPESIQMTKRMINETVGEHLLTQLASGAATSASARTTDAAQEGLTAFLEKRDPDWS